MCIWNVPVSNLDDMRVIILLVQSDEQIPHTHIFNDLTTTRDTDKIHMVWDLANSATANLLCCNRMA